MTPCSATLPRFLPGRTGRTGRTVRAVGSARPFARTLVGALATAAAVWVVSRSVVRVEVAGNSMVPVLVAGDRLVVVRLPGVPQPWPQPGALVAVRDPREPGRVLVKRVASVDRRAGALEVRGDAADASTDSRNFGPLTRSDLVGRVVYRYAPAERSGLGPWPAEYDPS